MEKFIKKYIEEATEILINLESLILKAEKKSNKDSVNEIFRLMHTLKGGGAMFGFENISDVTHQLESIFDLVRNDKVNISKKLLDASLETIDYVRLILKNDSALKKINHKQKVEELENLKKEIAGNGKKNESEKIETKKQKKVTSKTVNKKISRKQKTINSYRIFFKPSENDLENGTEPISLLKEITEIGFWQTFALYDYQVDLKNIKYDNTKLSWIVILATDNKNAIDDVFIFVEEDTFVDIKLIDKGNIFEDKKFMKNIDSFIKEEIQNLRKKYSKEFINIGTVDDLDEFNDKIINSAEEIELEEKIKETEDNEFGLFKETEPEESTKINEENIEEEGFGLFEEDENFVEFEENKNQEELEEEVVDNQNTTISSIRVASQKVDTLMNLVSELITTQARLNVFVETQTSPELEAITENLRKLSKQLRDNAFELSMLPLQTVVTRFQRMIRDLSQQFNKKIEFKTKGTSTELDKRIIENLIDPIMHLVRNCIDHGIETSEERIKLGKTESGTIFLNAYYSGTNVFLQVGDDGKGIDVEEIKQKAIRKGFLLPNKKYSDEEILNVIFKPGFSTAKALSEISGRGVGLDVAKRTVSELRGAISVDTKLNEGTTFTIKLPLTLSIIDGLLVEIGVEKYIIPMNIINKIYEVKHEKFNDSHYNILELDNKQIPYFYLRNEFNVQTEIFETEQILIVSADNKEIGIVVDRVIGENQAVLKPLGKMYKQLQIFSGATILGDGTVALVMDVFKIAEQLDS